MRHALLVLPFLALAGCASLSPEARVEQKLLDAGLKPRMARCVAERLVDRLSVAQLKELGRAAKLPRQDVGRISFDELLDRLQAVHDPRVIEVTASAGLKCAILH